MSLLMDLGTKAGYYCINLRRCVYSSREGKEEGYEEYLPLFEEKVKGFATLLNHAAEPSIVRRRHHNDFALLEAISEPSEFIRAHPLRC
jgi:hypothetical protein